MGESFDKIRDGVREGVEAVAEGVNEGIEAVREGVETATEGVREGRETAAEGIREGAEAVADGAESAYDAVRDTVQDGVESVERFFGSEREGGLVEEQVSRLNSAGDKVSLEVGGDVSVEGVRIGGTSQVEVSRTNDNPPRYVMRLGTDASAGLYGQLGSSGAGVNASMMARGGGSMEMTFDSPAEVARAVGIMGRQYAESSINMISTNPPPSRISAEDRAFMNDRMSAIEFRGGTASELAGSLDPGFSNANLGANVSQDVSVRFEFAQRNQAGEITRGPRAVLSYQYSGSVQGNAGPTGGQLQGRLQLRQNIELPRNMGTRDILQNPMDTVRRVADETRLGEASATFTLGGNLNAGAVGVRRATGGEMEIGIRANPSELLNSGAARQLFAGDLPGAMETLGDNTTLSYKVESIDTTSIGFSPEIRVSGFGGRIGAKAEFQDRTLVDQGQITASDAYRLLSQSFDPAYTIQ